MDISVIIPSYNRADLLPRTINSIIKQNIDSLEIVIVDDASQDNTQAVLKKIQDTHPTINLNVIVHKKNKGEAGARNTGIRHATAKYLAFLDSDDEWLPEKLRKQIDFLEKTNADAVTCDYFLVSNADYKNAPIISHKNDTIESRSLLTKSCGYCLGSSFLLKRESVLKVGFFDESLNLYVDMDWLYRYLKSHQVNILHEPLIYYHKSPMRNGDGVYDAYKAFLNKHREEFKSFSFFEKMRALSNFHYHVAISYDQNKHHRKSLKYYATSIFLRPVRHPAIYFSFFRTLLKSL